MDILYWEVKHFITDAGPCGILALAGLHWRRSMAGVKIDRDGCISCANCWTICPEVFEENQDDNRSQVIKKYRLKDPGEGKVPGDVACVKQAESECPVSVIHVSTAG